MFNVNNIQLEKNDKISNNSLSDIAIKKGFNELKSKILLKVDNDKLSDLNFLSIKNLVAFYQIVSVPNKKNNRELVNFNITFDKDKIHDLFYKRGILYSEISDKEFYVLPILIKENKIFIFNNNYFYAKWNEIYKDDLIEFILPLENIEIIKNINENRNSLINLDVAKIFQEYSNKNLALILIEGDNYNRKKVFIKTVIQEQKISKSLTINKENLNNDKFYEKIIIETKKEIINQIKSNNLIDIRTPSFLNTKLDLEKKSNLAELNFRVKNIKSIENIYIQEFNKDYINLRIKYLGKLEKLIKELERENINLQLVNNQWIIKSL